MDALCIECGEQLKENEDTCSKCGTKNDISTDETMVSDVAETLPSNGVSDQAATVESTAPPVKISTVPPQEEQLIGRTIGGAVIKKKIGKGGMGSVFLGHHLTLDIKVAIKFLKPEYAQRSPDAVERFLREARAVAKLRHPNIVSVYNAGFEEGFYFMSMEFIKGRDLAELLESPFNMSLKDALKLTCQICDALDYAHKNKIVHRDIKPANVFIDEDGNAKVGDLGLAKDLEEDQSMTQSMQSMGTPYYISPEQATSARDVDHRSDIYSLGCTFYRLFCGKVPYKGNSSFATVHKHLSEPVPDPLKENPEMPEKVAEVIRKMMAKKPEERYQTMGEISKILGRVLDNVSDSNIGFAPKNNPAEGIAQAVSEKNNKWLYAVIAILAVSLVAVAIFAMNRDRQDLIEQDASLKHKDIYRLAKENLEKGDYRAAKKLFHDFLSLNEDAIDAHLDFGTVLKQSEGIEGAREEYRQRKHKSESPSVHLAHVLHMRGDQRKQAEADFEAQFPDYGPYYYYTSKKWENDRPGQTFAEKAEELRLIRKFIELDQKGQVLKYFANRASVEEIRSEVEARVKALEVEEESIKNPIGYRLQNANAPTNPSVIIGGSSINTKMLDVALVFKESHRVHEVWYKLNEKEEFKSVWKLGQGFGLSVNIKVADTGKPVTIFARYKDSKGIINGPHKIIFDPAEARMESAKNMLNMLRSNWVSYRDYDNRLLFYFTTVLTYSAAFKEIRYSLGDNKLDKTFPFNPENPYENVYLQLPYETEKVFVQITFLDDTKTEIIEFLKPGNLRKE